MQTNRRRTTRSIWLISLALCAAIVLTLMWQVEDASADKSTAGIATVTSTQDKAAEQTSVMPDGEALNAIIKMFSALIVVIFCVYFGLYMLKRLMGRGSNRLRSGSTLEILDTAYVGPKKAISLVRVADRSVLVGVTDNQISVLTELDAHETGEILAMSTSVSTEDGFSRILKTASKKIKEFRPGKRQAVLES